MDKDAAIAIIDKLNKALINPVDMLELCWIRMIILQIPNELWEEYVANVTEAM